MNIRNLKKPKYLSAFAYTEAQNYVQQKPAKVQHGCNKKQVLIQPDMFMIYARTGEGQFEDLMSDISPDTMAQFKKETDEMLGPFARYKDNNIKYLYDTRTKFCPECIKTGRHFMFNQYKFAKNCPIHGIPLRRTCPHCTELNEQQVIEPRRRGAFTCLSCGHTLLEGLLPEQLIVSYRDDHSIPFTPPAYKEKAAFIFTTKEYRPYKFNPNMTPVDDYNIPKAFLRSYFLSGRLPSPDIIVSKWAIMPAASVEDILLDISSEVLNTDIRKAIDTEKDVTRSICRYIEENCDDDDYYARALYNIVRLKDSESQIEDKPFMQKMNYNDIQRVLMDNIRPFRCYENDKEHIVAEVLRRIVKKNYDTFVRRLIGSKEKKQDFGFYLNFRNHYHFQIVLYEYEKYFALYIFQIE